MMRSDSSGDVKTSATPEEPRLIEGRDIVCVSIMDWDWPFWTSRHHLMLQFARRNRVLFVDPPMYFASEYWRARRDPRLRHKLATWWRHGGLAMRSNGIFVFTPPPWLPINYIKSRTMFESLLTINQWTFRTRLRSTLARIGFRDPILWISFNVYCGDAVLGRLGESLSVYHCTDQLSAFPGQHPTVAKFERQVATRADVVITSSEVLRESMARHNPNSYFVPNGADVELFERAFAWDGPEPNDLRGLKHPRAGFVGGIEYRFDARLLAYAAEHLPDWSFILIGLAQTGNPEIDALRRLSNVHFLGLKERDDLPGYLAGLDVTLIPYKLNELTRGIYPLKLHEYLAAGKPVVATPLPSLQAMTDLVYLAEDGPGFVAAIEQAARNDSPEMREERRRLARSQDWQARATDISRLLAPRLRV